MCFYFYERILKYSKIDLLLLYRKENINIDNLVKEIKKKFECTPKDVLVRLDMSKRESLRIDILEIIERHNWVESLLIN